MKYLVLATLLTFSTTAALANHHDGMGEAGTEKAEAKLHDGKRAVKKAGHRVEEAACTEGTMGCTGEKIKNRAEEGKDYVKDKSRQLKNKVD